MARLVSGIAFAALALAAAAASAQQDVVVQGAMCRGEEPFWQLEASRTQVFDDPVRGREFFAADF